MPSLLRRVLGALFVGHVRSRAGDALVVHGTMLGNGVDRTLYEVFAPPLLRLDLWWRYWRSPRAKGTVVVSFVHDGSRKHFVRTIASEHRLPNVPNEDATDVRQVVGAEESERLDALSRALPSPRRRRL